VTGSPVYENWRAHCRGDASEVIFEFPLYSDTDAIQKSETISDLIKSFAPCAKRASLQDCPALILRINRHTWPRHEQTGEGIPDEFASLLSLLSGTRLAAGSNYSRRFGFDHDPLGQPVFTHETLVVPKPAMSAVALPHIAARRGFELPLLRSFPDFSPSESLVITKAARLYRTALWYSDSQGEYTWLMLVSAIETAAAFWQKGRISPEDQLGKMRPKLRELLLSAGGQELLQAAAKELADYMGATRKFVDFVTTFSPESVAQMDRPEKVLREVYSARSKALHSGAAIPDDLPITLADFEVVARDALVGWWKTLST
jgi:hypothetical protein